MDRLHQTAASVGKVQVEESGKIPVGLSSRRLDEQTTSLAILAPYKFLQDVLRG